MGITVQAPNEKEWVKAASVFHERHFMHAWAWGEFQQAMGRAVERRLFVDGKESVALFTATVHAARRGKYLEVGAASVLEWDRADVRHAVTVELRKIARTHKCVFVRLRPQLIDSKSARHWLLESGWRRSPMHLHAEDTTIIDITQENDELLKNMRQQTRYEVRKADKLGITVEWMHGKKMLDVFYDTQQETAKRQGFIPPNKQTLSTMVVVYGKNARIYVASLDGKALAYGLVLIDDVEAVYYEAASTLAARRVPAAYGLQWNIIQDLKKLGCHRYNLWGIAPEGAQNHRYSGVTTFKRGFGGDDTYYVPAQDLVVRPLKYKAVQAIEIIRKKKRGL